MKKKFAFLLMGPEYTPDTHQACFETENMTTYLYTVRTPEEAEVKVQQLALDGVGAIELCGAFGSEMARKLMTLTGHKVAIGYVVHDPEQDHLFSSFFSGN